MKKKITFLLCVFSIAVANAQTLQNYQFKAEFIYGNILKHTKHLENLVKGPVTGGELAVEWQTTGEKPWNQYFNFPKVGIGLVGLDLGNPEMLGQLLAVYPYFNLKLINTPYIHLNLKAGTGVSFLNKRFNNTATDLNDLNTGNAAIGSIVNVYFAGGGNLEIPLFSGLSLVGSYNWNHASNGSFYQPNSGINMLNASIGLSYFPDYKKFRQPVKKEISSLPQTFSFEVIAAGGARELYYRDNKMYGIASLAISVHRQTGNNLKLGIGIDGFYDGVYNGDTKFERVYITSDELKNKIRVGISFQPELVFGKLTAGMHFGLYIIDPLKNLSPYDEAKNGTLNKPLIYPYDIEKEDGWFYTRASLKYDLRNHLFASLGLKTHLQKAEFIEWGMGYRF